MKTQPDSNNPETQKSDQAADSVKPQSIKEPAKEIGGFNGPEPTRYNDWEKNGRCIDF